ncbi:MAG: M48 family peptidase, partial [Bacteroidota bacterium]
MSPELILQIIVIIFVGNHLLSEVLSYLNFKSHKPILPDLLADHYQEEEYQKSHAYHASTYSFGRLSSWISFGLTLAVLLLGGFGWLDAQLRAFTIHPVGLPLLFFGVLYILSDLLGIPFQWYSTFVIEEKFGFNKTTPKTFLLDKLKGYLLAVIVGGLLLGILIALIQFMGENFWWWFWIIISVFIIGINFVYTSWLVPLFNKLSPLEGGDLRAQIEAYSQKVGFPLTHIMVMDGSKRSTKANAFFS